MLAEIGLSADQLGQFAVRYPAKAARRLASMQIKESETALESPIEIGLLIDRAVRETLASQSQLLVENHVLNSKPKMMLRVGPHPDSDKPGTISLGKALIVKTDEVVGGKTARNKLIRSIYASSPAGISDKSKWVADQLMIAISTSKPQSKI